MNQVYNELKFLRKEIEKLEFMLIPQEKLSDEEARELKEILKEMKKGEEFRADEVFEE